MMTEYKKVSHFTFKLPLNFNKIYITELRHFAREANYGRVWQTKHPIWEYKKITTVQEYWNDKDFCVYRHLEPLWQRYIATVANSPNTNFKDYLLATSYSDPYYQNGLLDLYIKIWFETRNTIYQ